MGTASHCRDHANPLAEVGPERAVKAAGSQRVDFGLVLPQLSTTWEQTLDAARYAESIGADSVWVIDHVLRFPSGWRDSRGVDGVIGARRVHQASRDRGAGTLSIVSQPRVASEDDRDARPGLRRPCARAHWRRLVRAGVSPVRMGVPAR